MPSHPVSIKKTIQLSPQSTQKLSLPPSLPSSVPPPPEVEPETFQQAQLVPEVVQGIIQRNLAVQRVTRILINGRDARTSGSHPFPLHDNLVQRMQVAYTTRKCEDFLTFLREYLQRIPTFTPHCGRVEEAPRFVEAIEQLMQQVGFQPVAARLLSTLYHPA